ncbi:MAG: hypothetical protein II849_09705 [Bacteroidales bacterium]|nr:hypothetical protein [Bacteroidales bacterium]
MPKRCLLAFTKRLPSVRCIASAGCRSPTRSTSTRRDAKRTASTNQLRCSSCASDRRSWMRRGYDRMHHLPRHS